MRWRLTKEATGRSGAENMAIDASLLAESDATGRAFLRLYRFDPPCLSLGRNEPADQYDRATIARLGLDVVRRPTGGRAVWHEHEVTYAVTAPVAAFGSLRGAYRAIHERLVVALRSLGADATLALHRPPPSSTVGDHPASCFATHVGGEILVAGRKLVGSAQARKRNAFLQHGSILLDGSQAVVAAVSRKPHVASAATTLSAELGRRVTWDEVVEAVALAWRDESASPNLHQPPPTSTTSQLDLAPLDAP